LRIGLDGRAVDGTDDASGGARAAVAGPKPDEAQRTGRGRHDGGDDERGAERVRHLART
jgi:hypothetical protein